MTEQKVITAAVSTWRYPHAGDGYPPGGAKVWLLTRGGVAVTGPWTSDGRYLAWAPMPRRDRAKEAVLHAQPGALCGGVRP